MNFLIEYAMSIWINGYFERMMILDTVPSRLLICVGLVVLIALFRCVETAADVVSESRLRTRAEGGSKRAKRILKILKEPGRLYNCMRFVIILIELILASFMSVAIAGEWDSGNLLLNYVVGILVLAVVIPVFGVYLPRRVSMKNPEKVLFSLSNCALPFSLTLILS